MGVPSRCLPPRPLAPAHLTEADSARCSRPALASPMPALTPSALCLAIVCRRSCLAMMLGATSKNGPDFWATDRVLGAEPLTPGVLSTTVSIIPTFFDADEDSRDRHPVVHRAGAGHFEVRHAPRRALLLERCPRLLSSLTSHISTPDLTHAGVCAAARSEPAPTSPAHGHGSGGPRPQLRRRRHVFGRIRSRRRAISHARLPISHPRSCPNAHARRSRDGPGAR